MKLALLVAAWLAGVFLGLRVDAAPLPILLLLLAVLPVAFLLRLGRRPLWPAVLAGLLLLGLWRVEVTSGRSTPLAVKDSEAVTISGRIIDDPEATAQRIKFVLAVDAVDRGAGMASVSGKALVYADPPPSLVSQRDGGFFRYGDRLLLEGELQLPRPFGDFDYPTYLASQGISGILWSRKAELLSQGSGPSSSVWRGWIFDLRRRLSKSIEDGLPIPQSALAQALLLGLRGQLPPDVVEDFRATGTSHLLAISGLHVGVLLVLTMAAADKLLGRRRQLYLLFPLAAIWFYALVSGLPVSVVRAAIMGTAYLAALGLGRPRSALPALAFSAAVMVGVSPRVLMQVSFQLSFAALAGIILALPYQARISEAITSRARLSGTWWQLWFWQGSRWLMPALVISAAATLATWPLVAFNFDRIPLLGIFATLLALPALPFILLGSLATAALGSVHPLLGQFFGLLTWLPLTYLLGLVALLPPLTVSGTWVGAPLIWAWYAVLGGLLLLPGGMARIRGTAARLNSEAKRLLAGPSDGSMPFVPSLGFVVLAVALAAAGVFMWLQVFSGPDGKLHVYFFDVGQGDSVLIVTPGGKQVLIDGGPEAESGTRALAGPLSPRDRSLDLVFLTHLDSDHSRGLLEVLDRYRVGKALVGLEHPSEAMYSRWRAVLERRQVKSLPVRSGYLVELEPGISLEVLNPPSSPFGGAPFGQNNNALVLRLVHGRISYLLTSDVEAEAESYLVRHSPTLKSTVLKVAHHGSRTSTTALFLQEVQPALAVISAGSGNQFGHPHPEVVDRLESTLGPEALFRTDRDGTIEFISDGRKLWVRTERNPP